MSLNIVTISGNLTRDTELKATPGGTSVLSGGVAVNDRRRNPNGEWEDVPNFVDFVMFGSRAEALQRYLVKGTHVAIQGKLRYSSWEKDGQRRSKLEVVVDEIDFNSPNRQGQQRPPMQRQPAQQYAPQAAQYAPQYAPQQAPQAAPQYAPQRAPQAATQYAPQPPAQPALYDEDIPF